MPKKERTKSKLSFRSHTKSSHEAIAKVYSRKAFVLSEIRHHKSYCKLSQKSQCEDEALPNDFAATKLLDWNLKSVLNEARKACMST